MKVKKNLPQKGAARKWAARLKELGKQAPPKNLVDKINNGNKQKKKRKTETVTIWMDLNTLSKLKRIASLAKVTQNQVVSVLLATEVIKKDNATDKKKNNKKRSK